jgi:titin
MTFLFFQRASHRAGRTTSYRPRVEGLENRLVLNTYLVSNTNDAGAGSLRQAITDADTHPGLDTIVFNIGGGGVQTIAPLSALPRITDPVVIDATTQPGYAGRPLIFLDGVNAGSNSAGLWITAGGSTVKGLAIGRFTNDGILLQGPGNNVIGGNYIGTDVTGTAARSNSISGVGILTSNHNVIGMPGNGNVISGNLHYGVEIFLSSSGNIIQGNFIGTNATGSAGLGNSFSGVGISGGSGSNTVGGTTAAARNIISANGSGSLGDGVSIFSSANGNVVEGNFIGTDATGHSALPNAVSGVGISSGQNNQVGGTVSGAGNLISGNQTVGVNLFGSATNNSVLANTIGTDVSGTVAVANSTGVNINNGANHNTVAGNEISGNSTQGIAIFGNGTVTNVIQGNAIGTDPTATQAVPNGIGILISQGAAGNMVGGTNAGNGNHISGNLGSGVAILGNTTENNVLLGNFIGTDVSGSQPLGNLDSGVTIAQGARYNTVGGTDSGAGNVLSGNFLYGIDLFLSATGNCVEGNMIGTDVSGTAAVPNGYGIGIYSGANNNVIGGATPGATNTVSGNNGYGIVVFNPGSNANGIQGNLVGTDASGSQPLGNQGTGVAIVDSASNNSVIGNEIAFNGIDGVWIDQGSGNPVRGNSIFGDNGGLGIDETNGGDGQEDFPEVTSAVSDGSTTTIQGTLTSTPNTDFIVEFFANNACNPSGFGEGQFFLGSMTITTGNDGTASFTFMLNFGLDPSQFVTTTATDPSGNTSQFSACVQVSGPTTASSANRAVTRAFAGAVGASANPSPAVSLSLSQFAPDRGLQQTALDTVFAETGLQRADGHSDASLLIARGVGEDLFSLGLDLAI